MNRQHFTRRIVLSAVVVGLAILGTGLSQEGALAWRSKSEMQSDCEFLGGVFVDSPADGMTICLWADGSKHVCDQSGLNCRKYPAPPKKQEEPGLAAPLDATSEATMTDDTPIVAPVDAEATMTDDTQTIAPVDAPLQTIAETPLEPIAETPVEAPVAAEEPMAAEASAEQP